LLIIDKAISLAVTELGRKEINMKIGDHCFEFVKSFINPSVHAGHITYDRDDIFLDDTFPGFEEARKPINDNIIFDNENNKQIKSRNVDNDVLIFQPPTQENLAQMNREGVFFNNQYYGCNAWVEIMEPVK
jgi:hypothetical protein